MAGRRVAVAASGGRDSTALLHCTARAAALLGIEVLALHVHHGLMADADRWLDQVRRQARRWGAGFDCRRLASKPAAGESVEAWARRERYRALAEMADAAGCGIVLLAHHRRDQAETWLLQALRGGGPAGLSAMPQIAQRQGLTWARPWLDQPRTAIEAHLRRHRLAWVDDGSNADLRPARSRLRQQVWPALLQAFPDADTALAAAAARAQDARALADEVASLDLPPLLREGGGLDTARWQALPVARGRNALRAWLAQALAAPLPQTLVDRLCAELPGRTQGRWPAPGAELRLHRGVLQAHGVAGAPEVQAPVRLDLSRPGLHQLAGWGGHFVVARAARGGAAPALLAAVTVAARQGGEQFRLSEGGVARSLKKQFQARGLPAWSRDGPMLWTDDGRLLFVPGLGIDGALQAPPGVPQLQVLWHADPPGQRQPGG